MRLSALFEEFCEYLRVEKGAAATTIIVYRRGFRDFLESARLEVHTPMLLLSHFTVELCRAYQYTLDRRGCRPNTICSRLSMLSSFGGWLCRRGRLQKNPVDPLVRPRRRARIPRVPQWSVVEKLTSNGLDLRTRAIIALLAFGGLRRTETTTLNIEDFDPDFGLRRVRGKGDYEEAVVLPEVARRLVAAYLDTHRSGADPRAPLFVTRYITVGGRVREGRMNDERVYKLVREAGRKIGVPDLYPHAFRHACGTRLLEVAGGDLRVVQEHLRHKSLQTTARYTHLTKSKMREIVSLFDRTSDSRPAPTGG